MDTAIYTYIYETLPFVALFRMRPFGPDPVCCATQQTLSAASHKEHCLSCHTADMSAVSHDRHVYCGTQQICLVCDTGPCLLGHTADMFAVPRSRHVYCVTRQTCLLCHEATCLLCHTAQTSLLRHTTDMSAVSQSRRVHCVIQRTYLLHHPSEMSHV